MKNCGEMRSMRKTYIDIARGMALILLVLGHIIQGGSFLFNWIFSFHMPLFFFLSGMCVKEKTLKEWKLYVKKKIKSRILPYFVITAIGFFICMLIPSYRKPVLEDGVRLQSLHIFLLMSPRNLYIGQVWFLPSLFWAEIYFFIWYRLTGKRNLLWQAIGLIFMILIARNLWRINPYIPVTGRLPFRMDSAFMAAFCYAIGYYTVKYRLLERLRAFSILVVIIFLFINLYFGAYKNGYVNLCDLVFGNMWFYLIAMLSGIGAFILLAYQLDRGRHSLLSWYGKNSLPLFAGHTFLIYFVREIIYQITGKAYTMMTDVPLTVGCLMTIGVFLLFLPLGNGYEWILYINSKKFSRE